MVALVTSRSFVHMWATLSCLWPNHTRDAAWLSWSWPNHCAASDPGPRCAHHNVAVPPLRCPGGHLVPVSGTVDKLSRGPRAVCSARSNTLLPAALSVPLVATICTKQLVLDVQPIRRARCVVCLLYQRADARRWSAARP